MHRMWLLSLALPVSFLLQQPADACGDKLVSLSRGIRLQRAYTAAHSASILIYSGRSVGANTVKESKLQSSLKNVGHQLKAVEDVAHLDQALNSAKFDVLLVDFSEAATLAKRVASLPSRPVVIPVMYKPSKTELAEAQRQFPYVVKAPASSTQHLEAIDEAMKSKLRASRVS